MQAEQEHQIQRGKWISLALISEHPDNPSTHSPQDLLYLRASLKRYGQVRDLVVRLLPNGGYQMIAGHGMAKAMRLEGYSEAACTIIPADWSDVKAAGYLLIDNHRADDDDRKLLLLWEQQISAGEDLASVATTEDDLMAVRAMLAMDDLDEGAGGGPRPRAVPDAQQHQHVKLVLYMNQVDLVEQAIRKTGLENRGAALARICQAFIANDWVPAEEVLYG